VFEVREKAEGRRQRGEEKHGVKSRYAARAVGGEVAEDLFERGLCLPSGTAMREGELKRVVGVIRTIRAKYFAKS
jgi:dTDP-4-amino-4,6-dideoxygalactose transaminase